MFSFNLTHKNMMTWHFSPGGPLYPEVPVPTTPNYDLPKTSEDVALLEDNKLAQGAP